MERTEFEYLFIHANSLAELALRNMAAAIEQDRADEGEAIAPLGDDEREAQASALLGAMDLSAMKEGFSWEDEAHDAELRRALDELPAEPVEPNASSGDRPKDPAAGLDLGVYLERAYASRPQIACRVDAGMAKLDLGKLNALLNSLPADLPPLTQPLATADLAQWLAVYQTGDDALNDVVVRIRCLADEV